MFFEYLDALSEKFVAGVENLAFLVFRIIAVFADNEHGVDREPIPAATQGLSYRRVNLETEFLCPLCALVSLRLLVDVQRNDSHIGPMPRSVMRVNPPKNGPRCVARVRDTGKRW